MSNCSLIELWVDKRKLQALEKTLQGKGSNVEERMLDFFQSLYREIVPPSLQTKIDQDIQEEGTRMAAAAGEHRKVTAYRLTKSGQQRCFQTDTGSDILITALRLKRHLSGPATASFENLLSGRTQVSDFEFERLARLRMDGAEEIVGVFDLDFDRIEFSCVDPDEGWRTFPMDAVYSAMLRTEQKQGLSHEQAREVLMKNLEAWAVPSPGHLPMCVFEFAGKMDIDGERLTFQIDPESYFDSLDAALGTNTCTPENNDFLTVHAYYDMIKGEVCGTLEIVVNGDGESHRRPDYVLNDVEKECLRKKMDQYCQQMTGKGLSAFTYDAYRPQLESALLGSMSNFDLMMLYAELCVSDMADRFRKSQCASPSQPETDAVSDTAKPGQEAEPGGYNTGPTM